MKENNGPRDNKQPEVKKKKWGGNFFQNVMIALLLTVSLIVIVGAIIDRGLRSERRKEQEYFAQAYRSRTELRFEGLRDSLVTVTDLYIQKMAPGSALNGLAVVNACEKWDIDIRFVLVQGLVESHFGTIGIARKTNSVWNVGAYDKDTAEVVIKNGFSYTHPDHSVEPYCKLLATRYLKNATEEDLLLKFEDCNGHRYATNKQYESMLYNQYINIDKVVEFGIYDEYIKIKKMLGR